MSENRQDLEDYIQYSFDDIPSFKIGIFLNSGKVEVKVALGEVEQNFIENLLAFVGQEADSDGFFVKTYQNTWKIYVKSSGNSKFVVVCCGKTVEKDAARIGELVNNLL